MSNLKLFWYGATIVAVSLGVYMLAGAKSFEKKTELASKCQNTAPRVLQILGSGGPELDDGRNSSGYLIWLDGKARILIDAGSGVAENFGRQGAIVSDLDFIGLSHFHVDHTVGLPALIKNYFFEPKQKHIIVAGPDKGRFSPSIQGFMSSLFDENKGGYRYLGGLVGDKSRDFETLITPNKPAALLLTNKTYKISSSPVDHGAFPATAYKIDFDDKAIVFSGDTRASDASLIDLSKSAHILIAHHAIPQAATGIAARLHMKPDRIGMVAKSSGVKTLILSHRMNRTIGQTVEAQSRKQIRKNYKGPIIWAQDGQCVPF